MSEANENAGKSSNPTFLNVVHSYLERAIQAALNGIADIRGVDAVLRDLPPIVVAALHDALPALTGFGVSKIFPDSSFSSPEVAHFARAIIMEAAKNIGEITKRKGRKSAKDFSEAIDKAVQDVEGRKVLIDPLGHFHTADCVKMAVIPQKQKQESTLKAVVEQGLKASPCCHPTIQAEVNAPAPNQGQRKPSPLHIIGSMPPEERRKFNDWLETLTADERRRVMDDLHELDSEEEFHGFMAMDPGHRLEMLPLLESRNGRHAVKKFLGMVGSLAKAGLNGAVSALKSGWSSLKEFDAGFKARADALQAEYDRKLCRPRGETVPWHDSLKDIFSFKLW